MSETTQPDPQVVAWMRGHMRGNPGADGAVALLAYLRHDDDALAMHSDREVLLASARAANKPLAVADIPAMSLFIHVEKHGSRSLRVLKFKDADGTVRGVPYGASLDPDAPERAALWALIEAHAPTVTAEETP